MQLIQVNFRYSKLPLAASPHGIRYVISRVVRKPQQTTFQFMIWQLTSGLLLVQILMKIIRQKWGVPSSGHVKFLDHLSVKYVCQNVNKPVTLFREQWQPAYLCSSPRLLMGTRRFKSSQDRSNLSLRPTPNISSRYHGNDGNRPRLENARISEALFKAKTFQTGY